MRRFAALALAAACVLCAGAARAETVRFDSEDGFALEAELWPAAAPDAPVAILLHQWNADRRSFGALQPALSAAGFTVVAIDQRGQGGSTKQRAGATEKIVRIRDLPKERASTIISDGPKDVAAALSFVSARGLSADRVVLVGSSYGCTVSLLAAAAEPRVRALALLSPGADYFGVDVLAAARTYAGPLFAVAAEDDTVRSSPPGTRAIGEAHEGPEEIRILPKGGHGVALLAADPKLPAEIAAYLAAAAAK